jgi:hypothetical protein
MKWVVQLIVDIGLAPAVFFAVQGIWDPGTTTALGISVLVGAVWTVWGVVRTGRLNAVGVCVLAGLAAGVVLSLVTGDPRFAVAKDSLYTGALGLAMLASLAMRRPLMFHLIRPFASEDGDPDKWHEGWRSPRFRRCMRVMTCAWGIGLLAEALARIGLVYGGASLNVAAAVSPVLTGVVLVALMSWTAGYGRRAGEARRQLEQGA